MKYGLIGEKLRHSFSREIHAYLSDYKYELLEIPREELSRFMSERNFSGINVTIPYKEAVIPYLDFIDETAKKIGAVNTVVNRGGKLYGYNTDFLGMRALIERQGISVSGRKVAILGSGGTAKTAHAVSVALGAREVITVSRRAGVGVVTYEELYASHCDVETVINTTPVGMYPNSYSAPIDLSHFNNLIGVVDTIYNPEKTSLVRSAMKNGINATGGLYMLVAQAFFASELFLDTTYPEEKIEEIYRIVKAKKENIILTGMPASGKSTVGKILADMLSREFVDTDTMISESAGMPIPEIFEKYGEAHFRNLETEAIKAAAQKTGAVIATGGGAVLKEENIDALRSNGRIYFIDRPLEKLMPTADRPLSSTKEAITKRYNERYPIYLSTLDVHVSADTTPECVAKFITGEHEK